MSVFALTAGSASARAEGAPHPAHYAATRSVRRREAAPSHALARAAIIGGQAAASGTFPWMAFIAYKDAEGIFLCSGTVVSSNVILTAGHCGENEESGVMRTAEDFEVVTGNVAWDQEPRQVSGVSRVIIDAGYSRTYGYYDASLLELSTPTTAPAISLATWPSDSTDLEPGIEGLIAGWGKTYFEQEGEPFQLQWAETVLQGSGYCGENAPFFDSSIELCTVNPPAYSTGACHGDSGGPLLGANPSNSGLVQLGVISHGQSKCSTEDPTVYTRADAIQGWVSNWVRLLAPPPPPPPPAPAPTAPPAPAPPAVFAPPHEPGYYVTRRSKKRKIVMRVSGDGKHVVGISIKMPVNCQHGYYFPLEDTWLSYAENAPITDNVVRTTLELPPDRESRRGAIGVYLYFNKPGQLEGRLRVHIPFRSHKIGVCAGTLNFTAAV